MEHKFNVELATKYGIEKAIIISHIWFHQQSNGKHPAFTRNGKTYGFLTKVVVENSYPYLKYNSVRRWLKELEDDGVLESIQPNIQNWKQQKYYRLHDDISGQWSDQSGQSSINTNEKVNYVQFVDLWNQLFGANLRITEGKRKQINARLSRFSEEELRQALHNRSHNDWIMQSKYKGEWDSFWRNDEKVERYLNQKQEEKLESWQI